MFFDELNISNVNFIRPLYDTLVINKYCYRDEVAHPRKLQEICINGESIEWNIYTYDNIPFFSSIIPWNAPYSSYGHDINAMYFRVLCRRPSMFDEVISYTHINQFKQWLNRYNDAMFVITHCIVSEDDDVRYICSLDGNCLLDNLAYKSDEEMAYIIDNKCYTVCNGVTLILALIRMGRIDVATSCELMRYFFPAGKLLSYFQYVDDDWHSLYYNNLSHQVADFPSLYICHGPDFSYREILEFFYPLNDIYHIPYFQLHTHTVSIALPQSIMFPNFNQEHWEKHDSVYKYMYETITLRNIHDAANPEAVATPVCPDFAGLVQAFSKSEEALEYWNQYSADILHATLVNRSTNDDSDNTQNENENDRKTIPQLMKEKHILFFLKACFHYFKYGSQTQMNKARIRKIWVDILQFISHDALLNVVSTLYVLNPTMMYNIMYETIPIEFLEDVLHIITPDMLFKPFTLKGLVSIAIALRLIKVINNIVVEPHSYLLTVNQRTMKYELTTCLFKAIKLNDFHRKHMDRIIIYRLCCLKTNLNVHPQGHVIYDLMTHFYTNNRLTLIA